MEDHAEWAMYFASITSFQYHPRNDPDTRMTIRECADIADQMLIEARLRERRRANNEYQLRPKGVI